MRTGTGAVVYQKLVGAFPKTESKSISNDLSLSGIQIPFQLSVDLANRIRAINKAHSVELPVNAIITNLSASSVRDAFSALDRISNLAEEEQVTVEEYRAVLMKSVQQSLEAKINSVSPSPPSKPIERKKSSIWKWILFGILMFFEFGPDFYGGFLYASITLAALVPYLNLLPMISPVSASAMTWLGIGCVANSMIGSICFVAPILMERMGLEWGRKTQAFPEALRNQLDATEVINSRLTKYNKLSSSDFKAYSILAKLFNFRINSLKRNFPKLEEPLFTKIVGGVMGTLMTLKSASSALFMSANIVGHYSGVTLFDPIAITNFIVANLWTVGLVAIPVFVPHLIIGFYLRFSSTTKVINPGAEEYKAVNEDVNKYETTADHTFDDICRNKDRFEKLSQQKATEDVAKAKANGVLYQAIRYGKVINLLAGNKIRQEEAPPSEMESKEEARIGSGMRRYSI